MNEFYGFKLNKVIIHKLFKKKGESNFSPEFSDDIVGMSNEAMELIQERMVDALGKNSKSIEVVFINEEINHAADLVKKLFTQNTKEFIRISKELVNKLSNVQKSGAIKNSAILVFLGKFGIYQNECVIFLKAESDTSVQLVKEVSEEKFALSIVENSLLGSEQKLYKIAIVEKCNEDYEVVLFDKNLDYYSSTGAAKYFYHDFLECDVKDTSKISTTQFFNLTSQFISNMSISDDRKYTLQNALSAYLGSPGIAIVEVREFANTYFSENENRDSYTGFMEKNDYIRGFRKDLETATRLTKKRVLKYSNGLSLIGSTLAIQQNVKVIWDKESGMTKTVILGELVSQK